MNDAIRLGAQGREGEQQRKRPAHAVTVALLALGGCITEIDSQDGAFTQPGERVHCAVNLDSSAHNGLASLDAALDRAAARNEVLDLYAHKPGDTVELATIEHVLAGATARGLPIGTYEELTSRGGLALSFDDSGVETWLLARDLFLAHEAHVTFFVTRYATLNEERRAGLRTLAADGHAISAHSVGHLRAPTYVEEHGLAAYLADEALPSIEALRADGYAVPAFAWPFGATTAELDGALMEHVSYVRSVTFTVGGVADPCPR